MQTDKTWYMFVDGKFTEAKGEDQMVVQNPATGDVLSEVPQGTAEDIDTAVEAARQAFDDWRWTDPDDRAALLRECANIIEDNKDTFVELETLETGKPLTQSRFDVTDAARQFRFYAGAADKFYSDTVYDNPSEIRKKVYEPYGVVGIIIPWNFPPKHLGDYTAPALATGNTVVLKPAPETPLTSLFFAEIIAELLPDGVFNVVSGGTEPGAALTDHPDVDMLAFTGHDKTGEQVLKSAANHITPVMLELGGKNPDLVFPDADLEKAVSGVVNNVFLNSGQTCSGTERLLLHEDIYEPFLSRFAAEVEELTVGDGHDEQTELGPLINEEQYDKVMRYMEIAEDEGAEIYAQGQTPTDEELDGGYWAPPTVFVDVDPDSRFATEEVFGPVVGVIPFSDETEGLRLANRVDYGLTCTVWTRDINRGHRLTSQLEYGVTAINCPAGGVPKLPFGGYKRSGIGRKLDFPGALQEFTQLKSVRIDLTDETFSLSGL